MAAVEDIKDNGLSLVWTIQNVSYCAGDSITSPVFFTSETSNTKWRLVLYPKGTDGFDTIKLKLKLLSNFNSVEANFDLSICTPEGIFKHERIQNERFNVQSEYGITSTIRLEDMLKKESGVNINNDSMTVRCRIWKFVNKPVVCNLLHVRTIIIIEKSTCIWTMPNFMVDFINLRLNKRPIFFEKSSFDMNITLSEDLILIEIKPVDLVNKRLFSKCEISLLGIDGKIVYSVRNEHKFQGIVHVWKLLFISMDELLSHSELYLPNGTLTLRCEFSVSSGVTNNEMEESKHELSNLSKSENHKQEKDEDVQGSLEDNLECFYSEGKFSDLKIRTPNKDYPVHKTILCARSKVFSAMFESDTREKLTGVIEIIEIDDNTVSKMLRFLYTDTIGEDMVFNTASSLYYAADKYEIVALKKKCVNFLKYNLNTAIVCDVLILANMHQDQELKSAAQKFIFEHSGDIMKSEEWKMFMQNELELASETMHLFIQKSKF